MFIRPWLDALKSRWMPANRTSQRRTSDDKPVQSQVESLEDRALLAAFDLITVIPNQGVFLSDGQKLSEAPREVTLRFSPGQTIDPTTLGSISIVRAGVDGLFDNPATPALESTDDVAVTAGYVGVGDLPNEVIVRFANTLVDDRYQIRVDGTGANALGSITGDPFNNGIDKTFNFELDLGAQVEAVVPQPVIRSAVFSTTGLGNLTDGDLVTITAGANDYRFEINLLPNAATSAGNIRVDIAAGSSPSQIADALVAAINANTNGQLTASNGGTNTITVAGAAFEPVVAFSSTRMDAFAQAFLTISNAATLADGDVVQINLNNTSIKLEFNKLPNNSVSIGSTRVDFSAGDSAATIAAALAARVNSLLINSPVQQLRATVVGNSVAFTAIPALGTPSITTTTAVAGSLTQVAGTLSQKTDKVVVYFNQDQLNSTSAQDPKFYKLIDAVTGFMQLPSSVSYTWNAQNGLSIAVLTFAAALPNSTYNLKIGASTESNDTLATAIQVGAVFASQDFNTSNYLGDGTGTSANTADTDLYQFQLTSTGNVTLTLTSSTNLDGIITLLDAGGSVVGGPTNATGLGGVETLPVAALPAGTYFARVTSNAGTGGYKLRINSTVTSSLSDDNSSFTSATQLGSLGTSGLLVSGVQIEPQSAFVLMPQLPGGSNEPGHRELPSGAFTGFSAPEVGHGTGTTGGPSAPGATAEITYSFPTTYGAGLLNQITPQQKEIIRQIFAIFANEAGMQFREVASGGMGIVVGDIRVNAPTLAADQVGGISGSPLIINSIFYAADNEFGGGFTGVAFHEIGHNLGLGHSYDVPSIQGGGPTAGPVENVYTGDNDQIHLLRVAPDNSSDIDLYRFDVTQAGTLSAQTVAERLGVTNLLDSVLTLYRQDASGNRTVVARNDDFYSKDSGIDIAVTPGTYYIGVTSTGNDNYDPSISNSGFGGRSRGAYQLKLDFKPTATASSGLIDTTGQSLDGDHDGKAGGEYTASFVVANTRFVDKLAPAGGTGTLAAPYNTIAAGLAAVGPNEILRIVGNGGADGNASTLADNVPYQIGRDYNVSQTALADGATFQVPKDVTVMIDAGALVKIHAQTIDVGTSSAGNVRSNGVLQVLGTPVNNVTFTSWRDDAKGSVDDGTNGNPTGADWGGIVFRQDSDSALPGEFLNLVNHATIQYGGGQVSVDGSAAAVFSPIHLVTSRPTITNNTILNNADSAVSANPDSFKADDGRIGPDIHGNLITANSTNGLFIRIQTPLGAGFETLNVIARFDDTDITHVIAQNLILNGRPAGSLANPVSARLMIDPGTVVKLSGARIETGAGRSNLIAEGTPQDPIRFTSQQDDRYGSGGTFDLKNDGNTAPAAGNWSGIFVAQASRASLDNVSISYAGGTSEISGNTDSFNPVAVLQGYLRLTNSLLENNLGGAASTTRGGRGSNDSSTIFVRGAQPIIVDNVFQNNQGNVISINANSMQDVILPDYGRSTGFVDSFSQFDANYGPLVRLNRFANSDTFTLGSTLGMNVRGEELTIESVWDDTDIAHIVRSTIVSSEFHTYGGLRLQSSSQGSLVVKLQGATAGFSATGDPLDISDRIGGSVQIVGQPGFPVILTSLADDTISAGFKPNGFPQFDTNGDNNAGGASSGNPGDWRSISLDQYSNDRNVAIVLETEPSATTGNDINSTVGNPQFLGELAPNQNSGDENRRLGFEVHGFISPDSPGDVDVYSFSAAPGTEVWIDTDFTSQRLDVMVELLNSGGTVLARSMDSQAEGLNQAATTAWLASGLAGTLAGTFGNSNVNPLTKDPTLGTDFYTSNFHDAGFRAVLPGTGTTPITYFVRVRSQPAAGQEAAAIPAAGNGLTSGAYQLQVRLKQVDEIPGSTVRYADIRYATSGIVLTGLPAHSPLMGESAEAGGDNNGPLGGQYLGPLLQTDRNTLSVAGSLSSATDVDFFSFTVDYSQVQVVIPGPKFFPTMFDIDWADGLTRADTVIAVYNANRDLIYIGRESDIADDQPGPGQGQDLDDLSRGTLGKLDAFIGSVNLPAGVNGISETGGTIPGPPASGLQTYYVAVFSNGRLPTALSASFTSNAAPETQRVRLEPINSIKRVVEDHIGFTGYASQGSNIAPESGPLFNTTGSIPLQTNIRPFTLSDVNLFVTTAGSLNVVDPFTNNKREIAYGSYGTQTVQDIDMRPDGTLWAVRWSGSQDNGLFVQLNTGTGGDISSVSDNIANNDGNNTTARFQSNSSQSDAVAWREIGGLGSGNYDSVYYATADNDDYGGNIAGVSKLYRANTAGSAAWAASNFGASGNITDSTGTVVTTLTTGLQYLNGVLWGVSAAGQLYQINQNPLSVAGDGGSNIGNPDPTNTPNSAAASGQQQRLVIDSSVRNYSGILNGGEQFAGITDAPRNVENQRYASYLFIITNQGRVICVDPATGTLQTVFDSNNDNVADSTILQTGITGATGIAFSPVDFNLWHPTERRNSDLGHGVNTTSGLAANPSVDNSRVPSAESVTATFGTESLDSTQGSGGASMYFGLEQYAPGAGGNYYQYDSGGQYGVMNSASHQDLSNNPNMINNYNVPGGTAGSLVTNSFNLEGYTSTDKPTLYFNYWLQTEGAAGKSANSMRDSARVYVSVDNGLTWDLIATNNSTLSAPDMADAELPAFASASKSAAPKANQQVQELFDTGSWRQARVDLNDYVGKSQVKLRFDFSTSGRTGSVTRGGVLVPSDDTSDPTYTDIEGGSNGITSGSSSSPLSAQNNAFEGFYVDDIIVGFAGRGEMVTASAGQGSTFVATPTDPDPQATPPLLTGNYQLEIRRGEQYGGLVDPPTPNGFVTINPTLDINDRLTNGQTVRVGNTTQDGNTVLVSDGLITRTFEFNSVGGVSGTNIPVNITGLNPATQRGSIASALAAAINAQFAGRNSVLANAVGASVNSDRVDIFGAVRVEAQGTPPTTTALGSETESVIPLPYGNDYPVTLIANQKGAFSTGTPGYYTLTGQIGNSPISGNPDSDFFQVTLAAGQTLNVDLTVTGGTGTNYVLGVANNSGILATAFNRSLTFTAPGAGTYFLGVLGDDGVLLTPPIDPAFNAPPDPLASAGNDTFNYRLDLSLQLAGTTLPTPLSVDTYVRQGDDNLERQQGQIIIENNQILNVATTGIFVDDDDRFGSVPHPGAALNTPVPNSQRLITGLYLQNNTIGRFGTSGISITGDTNANLGPAIVPFVKVVNNTIYGGDAENPSGSTVGILVSNSASPTIMNNAIVNTGVSIAIDATSSTTEVEANLFQGNRLDPSTGNNSLIDVAASSAALFVNAARNNFYPAVGSPLVDSSRSTFNDRAAYTAVTGNLSIPPSPIYAPLTDRYGQKRVDDIQPGPSNQPGLGQNPFQDRGSVERADGTGGVVIPAGPRDNDGIGVDLDGTQNTIWIDAANPVSPFSILTTITLQLFDDGIGIDDLSVNASDFLLLENGTPLVEGQDYFFTYNQNTNECIFTSVSTFKLDARYQVIIDNPSAVDPLNLNRGITDLAGNFLVNNQQAAITPANPSIPDPFDKSLLYFTYVFTNGTNDAPVNSVGGVVAPAVTPVVNAIEDSVVTFNGALRITVGDPDAYLAPDGDPNTAAQGGRIRVTLSIPAGTGTLALPANSTTSLLANGGSSSFNGSPVTQIVLEGRIDDLNVAINGLTYTPTPDFPIGLPSATVNVTVFTEDLGKYGPPAPGNTVPKSTTTQIPVLIAPQNDTPTFTITTTTPITILEDVPTPTQIDLTNILAGGGESQSLRISATSDNQTLIPNGSITIGYPNAQLPALQPTTGSVSFTAAPDRFGSAVITITLQDAGLDDIFGTPDDLSFSQNVTVNVTSVNDAPLIDQPANQVSLEDTPATVTLTGISVGAFEFPGQTLTLTAVSSDPTLIPNPTISYVQGSGTATLSYTPGPNRNGGPVTITVTAQDDGGVLNGGDDITVTTFTITVTPVNDPPTVTVPVNATVLEDSVSGQAPNAVGSDIVLTNITPGPFESSQTIQSITVTSGNTSIIPNSGIVLGTLNSGNLPLTITPLPNQFGPVTLTVTITDNGPNGGLNGDVNVVVQTFVVNVVPVNDQPTFGLVPQQSILEDAGLQTITLTSLSAGPSNESSQTLTVTATSLTPNLIANPITVVGSNTIQYTPVANAHGQATIRITVTDNGGTANNGINTYFQDVIIDITAVDDAPTIDPIANQPVSSLLLEDAGQQTVVLTGITAGPPDEAGQTLSATAAITSGNTNLVNNITVSAIAPNGTATLNYTPVANEFGTATVTVTVTDSGLNGPNGAVNVTTQTFTITVTPVNDAPHFDDVPAQQIFEDSGANTITLTGVNAGPSNESAQLITVTAVSLTPNLISTPTVSGNTVTYTPVGNANGQGLIRVTLTDNGGTLNGGVNTYTKDIVVDIAPVNDAPTLNAIPNQPVAGTLLEDSGTQTINLSGITAGPADEANQSLTVTAAITSGNSNLVTNLIPSGVSPTGTATLSYTPVANEFGTATVTVTVTDSGPNGANGAVNSFTRTFTITVTPVNDAPSFNQVPPQSVLEDAGAQTITLTGLSTGPANESNQTLILSAVSLTPSLLADPTISGGNTLTYTPLPNANGTATIRVTLRDNGGTTNGGVDTYTQDIVVNITPVNDVPTINQVPSQPVSGLLLEDAGQQTINLSGISAGPANENNQSLTISAAITGGNPNLVQNLITSAVAANGTATLRYTPVANEFGTATITLTVTDNGTTVGSNGDVNTTTQVFTITVTPVNDQPTINPIGDQLANEDSPQQTVNLSGISVGPANESGSQTLSFVLQSDNPALIPNDAGHLSIVYTDGNPTGQLLYTAVPNGFGTANITVTMRDTGLTLNGGIDTVTRTFKVTVVQVPDAPTNIQLAGNQVPENRPSGTVVGTLSTTDVDLPADNFTYSIIDGSGLGLFQISGNQLQTSQALDFEPPGATSYSLTIRATDNFGLTFDKAFNVVVLNLNDSPTLDPINSVTLNEDPVNPVLVNLTGITAGSGEIQGLTITATSDNPNLFNNPIPVNYTSPNSTGTLSLVPRLNASGTATITVTVQDNGGTANGGVNTIVRTFQVTVNPTNDNPTDIILSNDTIAEIAATATLPAHRPVGQLTSIDPDNPAANNTFSYSLVTGPGSGDNDRFSIVNDQLFAEGPIDFDERPDYTIRVRTTDSGSPNLSFEKILTIRSTNVNEPASSVGTAANPITGIPNSIPENLAPNSVVGTLVAEDPDSGETTTFTLVSGVGATDNALFKIVNGQLVSNTTFNFETKSTYSVRIRSVDSQGLVFEGPLIITITDANEPSTNIELLNNTVAEDIAVGGTIGTLTTQDVDNPESFTYSLVSGTGSTDNSRFSITGNTLRVAAPLSFEDYPTHSYSIRVRSTDSGGLTFEKVLTINVTDVNEAPTDLTLTPAAINENLPVGSQVGTLTPVDPDIPDTYTFAFVNGTGSTDNALFQLSGNKLLTAVEFDFEAKSSYTVRVRATDGAGHSVERQFTITVNDTKDGPVIVLASSTLSTTGHKAVNVDAGGTITDIDTTDFNGGRLEVKIRSGEQTGDVLGFKNEPRNGGLTLKAKKGKSILTLGKQTIGTISGGVRGIPLVIQFNQSVDQAVFQRVIRSITFRGKPFAAPRQIAMQAFDELGLPSKPALRNINVS